MSEQDACQQTALSPFNSPVRIATERNQGVIQRERIFIEVSTFKKAGQYK